MANAIPLAIAGRFLLSFTSANELLQHDHLLSSPLTSYPRCALYTRQFQYFHWLVLGSNSTRRRISIWALCRSVFWRQFLPCALRYQRLVPQNVLTSRLVTIASGNILNRSAFECDRSAVSVGHLRCYLSISCRADMEDQEQDEWEYTREDDTRRVSGCTLNGISVFSNLLWSSRFLLNPYLFLSSLALSTSTLENMLFLLSTLLACKGKYS